MVEVRDFAMELMKLKGEWRRWRRMGSGVLELREHAVRLLLFSLCLLGEFANTDINQSIKLVQILFLYFCWGTLQILLFLNIQSSTYSCTIINSFFFGQ